MRKILKQRKKKIDPVLENFEKAELRRHIQAHERAEEEVSQKGREGKIIHFYHLHKLPLVFGLTISAILLLILFTRQIASIIALLILAILASLSTSYQKKLGMPLGGVELVTFGTVIAGMAFGTITGFAFGIITSLASQIAAASLGPLTWVYVITIGILGAVAGNFAGVSAVLIGMGAVIANLLINQVVYIFIGDEDVKTAAVFYIVVNLVFNAILFGAFGNAFLNLLK